MRECVLYVVILLRTRIRQSVINLDYFHQLYVFISRLRKFQFIETKLHKKVNGFSAELWMDCLSLRYLMLPVFRVSLLGIPKALGIWVRRYPKHGDTQITVTAQPFGTAYPVTLESLTH